MSVPNALHREWMAFWLALGFLSRLPMLARIEYSQALMNQSSLYFPLVGLILGGLYVGLFQLASLFWPVSVAVWLVLGLHLWLTGAFHEDGWADSADALGGGYTLESRLRIMKDSRIGTYGSVALVMALALKAEALIALHGHWLAWLLPPVVARLSPLLLMRVLPYVSDPDTSKSKPVAEGFSAHRCALALIGTLAALAGLVWSGVMPGHLLWVLVGAVLSVVLGWGIYLRRTLGGYTGDTLGASVILTELAVLLGVLASWE